jgi:hypothetical protein
MILNKDKMALLVGLAIFCAIIASIVGVLMNAQADNGADRADEVSVVPIQLGRESYGIAMVDPKRETVWLYEINTRGPAHSRLKLLAARSWHYDKLLEEYNSAEPKPKQVKDIIEQLMRPNGAAAPFESNSPDISAFAEPNKIVE